jgi:copper(I)-binding protein
MRTQTAGATLVLVFALLAGRPARAAIEVSEAWTRVTPPGVTVAVGYFTLKNTGAGGRELLKITSPLAERISLHRSSVDANGVSRMWPVGKLELAPGEVRRFEPNGYHLMLEGLAAPLRAGTRIPVTMVFEDEEPVVVQLEVRPLVAAGATADSHAGLHAHN